MKIAAHGLRPVAIALVAGLGLAGCVGETLNRGFVPSDTALQQLNVGAPREQVCHARLPGWFEG